MMTVQVDIILDDNGDITVSPTTLHVHVGDEIQWEAFGGAEEFMLVFRDGGVTDPDGNPEVRSAAGVPKQAKAQLVHELLVDHYGASGSSRPVALGNASGARGTHPYQLAIREKGNSRLHMDNGCPEVIIR